MSARRGPHTSFGCSASIHARITFHTADHPRTPDAWGIVDELVAQPAEPPTQTVSIAVRPDGSVVAVYGGPEKIHLRMRAPGGGWNAETIVDSDLERVLSGPQAPA